MSAMSQKVRGDSLNISAENRHRLKALFPSVFTEIMNDQGELVESIDFEKLKAELGTFSDFFEGRREHYGMEWPGKKDALRLIQTPSCATLKPRADESINFDTTENLFIEGENLEVLKLLQKSYYGQVKMIYIDPPYNTGKDFIYHDNFTDPLDTYLKHAGLAGGDGKKLLTNVASEGRFHTNWLNMMYPRLYLARNLLRDDGVIFISIDDNEVSNLRKLCDEVFGEDNFIAALIWEKKKKGSFLSGDSTNIKEYILVFSKNRELFTGLIGEIASGEETYPVIKTTNARAIRKIKKGIISKYSEKDYVHQAGSRISSGNMEMILLDDLVIKGGVLAKDVRVDSNWIYSQKLLDDYADKNELYITRDLYFRRIVSEPREKQLKDILFRVGEGGNSTPSFSFCDNLYTDGWGTNEDGFNELHNLFGKQSILEFPKPSKLIAKIALSAVRYDKNAIILDFFAGSATTAHALLELNKQDGGNRKFILVQIPELCASDSEAFKAGYKTIADIGKERVRRVIKNLNKEDKGRSDEDRGFRVLKLDKSNFQQWHKITSDAKPEEIEKQLTMHIDHIDRNATVQELLYEILLKEGFLLTEEIEIKKLAGKKLFSIAGGKLLICLDDRVTKGLIDAVIAIKPELFICLDSAFGDDDQLKANAVLAFDAINSEKHEKINFKTI